MMDSEDDLAREDPARRDIVDVGTESGAHPVAAPSAEPGSVAPSSGDRPAAPEVVSRRALARVRALAGRFFRESGTDALNLTSLGALAVAVFLLKLESIGAGGDAFHKWHFVRQWFYANDFSSAKWDHHMARLGVNGIAFLVQWIFGRGPRAYYIAPVTMGVLQVLFVYVCGTRLGGRLAGVLGALLLVVFPPMHAASSQLMPEVFQGTYTIIATYFFLRYVDAEESKRTRWLVAMAITVFVDYLAKETSVFFIPGFVVAIWMVARGHRVRDLAIFLGICAVGVACETAFYQVFTNYAHRFAIVTETHISEGQGAETDFWGLFDRYEQAEPAWRFAFYMFTGTSIGVVAFARNVRASAVVIVGASYLFFLTFLVRHIHPIVIWQMFRSRYLDPVAPFVLLVTGLFLALVLREVWKRNASLRFKRRAARVSRVGSIVVLVLCVLVGDMYYRGVKDEIDENPLVQLPKIQALVNDTYRRNLPLVASREVKGLQAAFSTIVDDRLLAKKGFLPGYLESKKHGEGKTYFTRDPSAYNDGALHRLLEAHCYMEVVGKGGFFSLRRMKLLPKECDAELVQPPGAE